MRASVLSLTLSLLALSSAARGDRARVKIASGTVVSDIGTRLRGATMELMGTADTATAVCTNPAEWKGMHDLKLNVIRFDVKLSDFSMTLTDQLPLVDKAVDLAAQNGMYIMLMNSVFPGTHNTSELTTFWSTVAARYKSRTHVLYEMVNEPVSWCAADYSATDVADLKSIYDIMRPAAPDTMIVLWTFACLSDLASTKTTVQKMAGVPYTNELVGYHAYGSPWSLGSVVSSLDQQYPMFMTETSDGPPTTDGVAVLAQMEGLGQSWVHLSGKNGASEAATVVNALHAKGYDWPADDAVAAADAGSEGGALGVGGADGGADAGADAGADRSVGAGGAGGSSAGGSDGAPSGGGGSAPSEQAADTGAADAGSGCGCMVAGRKSGGSHAVAALVALLGRLVAGRRRKASPHRRPRAHP